MKKIKDDEAKNDKKRGIKKRKAEPAAAAVAQPQKKPKAGTGSKKKVPKLMKKANGQFKQRVTSQGNKRMSIPDELFPEFCRRISAQGTGERMKLINQFAEDYPTVSVRQVTLRLGEITTKELPECVEPPEKKAGRAFMFYLRPKFYKFLPEDERPNEWERYAEEDEVRWQMEMSKKRPNVDHQSVGSERAESVTSDRMDSASNISPSIGDDGNEDEEEDDNEEVDDDGEETEDEREPVSKRLKMES